MTTICTCGCKVEGNEQDLIEVLNINSVDRCGDSAIATVSYCKPCADQARKDGIVLDEFQYPEDRGEIYGEPNEEEAAFYFSLMDFEALIERYGAQFVLSRMRNEAFEKLSEWFYDTQNGDQQERAWLLKKQC